MNITMDKRGSESGSAMSSYRNGVRDGFRTGVRGLCPDTADPYSYWAGWSDGDAARHGEEVTVDVAQICGLKK